MAEVRSSAGAPAAGAFSGIGAPSPGTPIVVDTATGKLYAMTTGDVITLVADGKRGTIATNATTGFAYLPACAGTPTGVPANTPTGAIPFVYDTAANKLWAYNGSWRGVAVT